MKSGFFCIDKPEGITSHSVVSRMRKILDMKKIGHSGTLDPMATGVMVVGFGTSTRLLDYVQSGTKEYIATISFGDKTSTADRQGDVIESIDMSNISRDQLENVLDKFQGEIEQIPPMVSAIKVDGKKLYEYEREGKTIERKSRKVKIEEIEVLDFHKSTRTTKPTANMRVVCSAGTYIRTLAEDIAGELGGLAHLTDLRRTKNGNINQEQCIGLEELAQLKDPYVMAKNSLDVLGHIKQIELDGEQALRVSHGKSLTLNPSQKDYLAGEQGPVFIVFSNAECRLIAIYSTEDLSELKSRCVVFLD
ncbi:MAG TPA: tRNA pseudouridine(55) synthase TruB [Acidimicrobiia bacterium]|nr:tRNA pseudouridine(55) synthase TruB [Acidimicrobiia bacterium]